MAKNQIFGAIYQPPRLIALCLLAWKPSQAPRSSQWLLAAPATADVVGGDGGGDERNSAGLSGCAR